MKKKLILMLLFFLTFLPREALAYLDPGTGSYITQVAIATVLGGLYVVKSFWSRIVAFVARLFERLLTRKGQS